MTQGNDSTQANDSRKSEVSGNGSTAARASQNRRKLRLMTSRRQMRLNLGVCYVLDTGLFFADAGQKYVAPPAFHAVERWYVTQGGSDAGFQHDALAKGGSNYQCACRTDRPDLSKCPSRCAHHTVGRAFLIDTTLARAPMATGGLCDASI